MSLQHITIERLQEIEAERAQTQADVNFHHWMEQLRVGKLCVNQDGVIKAQQMMENWNYSQLNDLTWE